MHARLRLSSCRLRHFKKAEIREDGENKENLKNVIQAIRREGRQLLKNLSQANNKGKNISRQAKVVNSTSGGGARVGRCARSLRKGGREQGDGKGVLDAMRR